MMRPIDVRDLLERPGASRALRLDEAVEGLKTELAAVPEDRHVEGDLLLESVVEGIHVSGDVSATMALRCARCLREFDRPLDVHVSELVVREAGPEDDYALAPDLTLDPEPIVRDAVVLSLPFSPLCRPDCLGLCERCGGDRNLGECTCRTPASDPRWLGLDGLTFDR